MNRYRVGIVGTGHIADSIDDDPKRKGIWSHASAYREFNRTKLTAACDIDRKALVMFGRKWGVKNLFTDYRKMLENEKIDILSICTPTKTHYEIVKNAIDYDIKAIFCEKPLAFSYRECKDIADRCRKRRIVFAVNYFRRWDNLYLKIKELIDDKRLGQLKTLAAYSNTALYMNTSHMIDLILMLCGRITAVSGRLDASYIREVHGLPDPGGIFHFTTEKGVEGILYGNGDSRLKHQFEIDLQFTQGRIRSSNYGSKNELFVYKPSLQFSGLLELKKEKFPRYLPNERVVSAIRNIVDVIEGKRSAINCSGEDAAESVKVIETFYKTSGTRKMVEL